MIKNIISAMFAIAACLSLQAQDMCVIKGRIGNDKICYEDAKIRMVYLTRLDEYDRLIKIDSTML